MLLDMKFEELIDEQWEFIRPLLPPSAREERSRADDRRTINAMPYVLTTGCRWMDFPREYGDDSIANLGSGNGRRWTYGGRY
jgi:transposase